MKKQVLLVFMFISAGLFAQEEKKKSDSSSFNIGDTKIIIIESHDENEDTTKSHDGKDKFNSWSGIDLGINLLQTSDGKLSMSEENKYMELDYARSLTWNFNMIDITWDWFDTEKKHGYNKSNAGIATGFGLSFKNYSLKNNYALVNVDDSTFGVFDSIGHYNKNKLRALYLKMPVLFQVYTMKKTKSKVKNKFHIAAGVVGGLRLGSSYKVKYKIDGEESKGKERDDFNLSSFTLDAEVRLGFGPLNMFASYGLTPLFEEDRGPELYPLTVGLNLTKAF